MTNDGNYIRADQAKFEKYKVRFEYNLSESKKLLLHRKVKYYSWLLGKVSKS